MTTTYYIDFCTFYNVKAEHAHALPAVMERAAKDLKMTLRGFYHECMRKPEAGKYIASVTRTVAEQCPR